jgi:putative ABC transport system permease protein
VYLRLLAESLRRGGRRKLLAATAVALGVLAATAVAELLLAAGDRLAAELGSYGANLEIVPDRGDGFEVAGLAALREIFWANNVVAAAPLYPLRVRMTGRAAAGGAPPAGDTGRDQNGDPGGGLVAPLVGTWFDRPVGEEGWRTGLPATRPTLEVGGRWPRDGAAETAVGRRLAARLGLRPGDGLGWEIGGRRGRLEVVGVVTSGGEEEEQAFAPLALVQAAAGRPGGPPGGRVPRAEVFALTTPEPPGLRAPAAMTPEEYDRWYCTAYPSSVAHQIGEALDDASARPVPRVTAATAALAGRLRPVLAALAAVALAGAVLGVAAVATASALERRLEAGLAAALGAESWKIVAFLLSEAALLGAAGGLAGGLAGLPAGRILGAAVFGLAVPASPPLVPLAVAAGALLTVAGSLPALVRPLTRQPATLLKGATA